MATGSFQLLGQPQTGDNQFGSYATGMPSPGSSTTPKSDAVFDFSSFMPQSNTTTSSQTSPGIVPPSSANPQTPPVTGTGSPPYNPGNVGGTQQQGGGITTIMPQNPQLSQQFFQLLQSMIGQGATPFNLSASLPSSEQATTPGSLTAPLTDVLSQLQDFYKTGTGGPTGSSTLGQAAATGLPTDVGPAWQAMLAAENQNTQNNAANLREQFAFGGDLKSSPFGSAMQQFYNQNTLNQNAQLTAAEQQAQEAAAGRQLTAATTLQSGAQDLGSTLQNLDQSSIQNLLSEFIRTQPEYSPYLNMLFGASTTYPPSEGNGVGVGGLGGTLASAGSALTGIADLWGSLNKPATGSPSGNSTTVA